ncbi:NINE protein [Lacipirellula sp.]|uniref:NINE protein n=1 Tax=Lacipirellula sp. TaxID=2691419 RepID=UPI003D132E25
MTALLLAWTIGGIGAHKFYLGRTSEGWIYLLFCWTFLPALAALFDGFSYLGMSDHRFAERYGSLNESRAAASKTPMTVGDVIRWTLGILVLLTAVPLLLTPSGWIVAFILGFTAVCLIPPTWNWICGTPVARRFGPQVGFWGLTILGGLVLLGAIVGLVTSQHDRAAMPFFALFGLSLLPSIWKWLERQFQKPTEAFTTARWCLGLAGLVMAGLVTPSRGHSTKTHEVRITREEYGDAWPFTVNEGILSGKKFGESVEVTFAAGASTYYLNGTAQQRGKYADLHEIWANDGEVKKSVSPITGRGVKLASGIDEPYVKKVVVAPSPKGPIRCDRFDLTAAFESAPTATQGSLKVKLDTDLPDSTELTISVSRGYFNASDREEYVIDYFATQSTVGEWRDARSIALDHAHWERALAKSRASFAAVGERFRINGVNGSIEVGAVVPLPQVRSLNIVGDKVRSDIVSDYAHLRWNVKTK